MAYPNDFIRKLEQRGRAVTWAVESVSQFDSSVWNHGLRWWAASTRMAGPTDSTIEDGSVRLSSSRLNIQTWRYADSGFSFVLTDYHLAIKILRRGFILRLRMGFEGDTLDDTQVVTFGRVQSMEIRRGKMNVTVAGPLSLFLSRQTTTDTLASFFRSVGNLTTVNASFIANSDTTLTVVSTAGFQREDSAEGAIKCYPSGGTPFYLEWSGSTGTTFTVSASDKFGTAQANLSTSDLVEEVALLHNHPLTILRKFMVSTGTAGTHGSFDDYPEDWAMGMPLSMVNTGHTGKWAGWLQPASGNFIIDVLVDKDDTKTDGVEWLMGILSRVGVFPVMHQGELAGHCALDPENLREYDPIEIDDIAILEVLYHRMWDTTQTYTAADVRIISSDGSGNEDIATFSSPPSGGPTLKTAPDLPTLYRRDYDLSDILFQNNDEVANLLFSTIGKWATMMPEVVGLKLRDHRAVAWSLGQVVSVSTPKLTGRMESGVKAYENRLGIIIGITPVDGPNSSIDVAFPPYVET